MILAAPAIILTAAVTVLAALICLAAAILVARTRRRHGIAPPAMSGNPQVEWALRVQGNTVEQALIFLPLLWMAALYFQGWLPPAIGLVWCLGRIVYALGYMSAPKKRSLGFGLTVLSSITLAVLAVIGIAGAWNAAAV
jgi:glutathione S-transferase